MKLYPTWRDLDVVIAAMITSSCEAGLIQEPSGEPEKVYPLAAENFNEGPVSFGQ